MRPACYAPSVVTVRHSQLTISRFLVSPYCMSGNVSAASIKNLNLSSPSCSLQKNCQLTAPSIKYGKLLHLPTRLPCPPSGKPHATSPLSFPHNSTTSPRHDLPRHIPLAASKHVPSVKQHQTPHSPRLATHIAPRERHTRRHENDRCRRAWRGRRKRR